MKEPSNPNNWKVYAWAFKGLQICISLHLLKIKSNKETKISSSSVFHFLCNPIKEHMHQWALNEWDLWNIEEFIATQRRRYYLNIHTRWWYYFRKSCCVTSFTEWIFKKALKYHRDPLVNIICAIKFYSLYTFITVYTFYWNHGLIAANVLL